MAEFERELIRDRTKPGMGAARAAGRPIGRRPSVMTPERIVEARRMLDAGSSIAGVARVLGVSRRTVYRSLEVAS